MCLLWAAQPPQLLCELQGKPLMLQGSSHAGKPHTTAPQCPHCPSQQARADCRAEALTGTETRLIWTENTLISVTVKVAEPIHFIQRVATSKSSGTC